MDHTYIMNRPRFAYHPKLKERAKELRLNSTKSEIYLWKHLKGKQIHGFDFHRQKPIDRYIIDFFCCELYLGIELDGYTHNFEEEQNTDRKKEQRLEKLGIKIIRFWDEQVFDDLNNVLSEIEAEVLDRKRFMA